MCAGKLLYKYGSAEVAREFAERALDDAATADFHIAAVADLYAAASESIDPAVELAPLIQQGRLRAEDYRESFRSRAGRLWAGDDLERWLGKALGDDLLLATWGEQPSAADSTLVEEGERLKSRVLLDHLGGTLYREPSSSEARTRVQSLEGSVLHLKKPRKLDDSMGEELRLNSRLAPIGSDDRELRLQSLEQAEALLESLEAGTRGGTAAASAEQIIAALEPGEVLLDYFNPFDFYEPSKQTYCAVLSNSGGRWARVPRMRVPPDWDFFEGRIAVGTATAAPDVSPLGYQVMTLRTAIRDGDDEAAESILQTLWQLLIQPVIEAGHHPKGATR
jgi:hypothetical protein